MWIETPDDPNGAMVNLQNIDHLKLEQIDVDEFALIAYACPEECCGHTVIKKSKDYEFLRSIFTGIATCMTPENKFPWYPMTTPTLH